MESSKSLNEAIFRSHQSTGKVPQTQEKLYNMSRPVQNTSQPSTFSTRQVPLNESHKNLMQSWMTLRSMDNEIAENLENNIPDESQKLNRNVNKKK